MNDVRGWIQTKLKEEGYSSEMLASQQMKIVRDHRPDAQALCIGLEDGQKFDATDLDIWIQRISNLGFVVVVPTRITHAAHERAEEHGIFVGGFRDLIAALANDDNIADYVESQVQYERRRLNHNRAVKSVKRKGYRAYKIQRHQHRPLTIATTNNYEFTADQLYKILEDYEGIDLDLIVVTNPNFYGFSTESQQAASQAGIPLIYFGDLLDGLGTKWT